MWFKSIGEDDLFNHPEVIPGIVSVYQQAFGGEPWNEGYKCPVCDEAFPLVLEIEECPACKASGRSVLLVEYWPNSKVTSDFYREMMRPGSLCFIAGYETEVVGFAWGYNASMTLGLDTQLEASDLHTIIEGDFFYLDECAVAPLYQGRGIGRLIVERVFIAKPRILLRTMDESRMCRLIQHLGGRIVQRISRGRVIMTLGDR